uniref:Uncharacterized protein n=1 Tax=Meloidogyne enterolobii TaxID=390850 RepID=A0A6V7YAE1_MELEN|nr:unnamed protein product [Meloidogyne enterolobii]
MDKVGHKCPVKFRASQFHSVKNALKYFLQLNIHKYMHVCINISTTFGKIGVLVLHRRQHYVFEVSFFNF